MENQEDFSEFGSHFLDSMLEVEMTEEDGEVNVSQPDDSAPVNNRELPPIPRFDLQTNTLTYKDVYSNSKIPVKQTSVQKAGSAQIMGPPILVPVTQSAPMLLIHPNFLKPNNAAPKSNVNTVQSIPGKPSPVLKALLTKAGAAKESAIEFQQQVFRSEYSKTVFCKQESYHDVSVFGDEENKFYKSTFKDISKVQLCKLHCTICDKHLGCGKDVDKKLTVHTMLKVITCKLCYEFYGDGNFPCDEGDHCEIYCRWCGQGGALVCCSFCPKVFCKKCVRRNFGRALLKAIERANDWACFICAQKPLWPHRAVCRALVEFIKLRKSDPKALSRDTSLCCKSLIMNRKILPDSDRRKMLLSGGQAIQFTRGGKEPILLTGGDVKNKLISPDPKSITGNGNLIVKNLSGFKVGDSNKSITVINKPQTVNVPPKIGSSLLLKNSATRNSVAGLASNLLSQTISSPIYHGQTLITPPGAKTNSPVKKPCNLASKEPTPPYVKVSVSDWVNVDINKIPIAKIPHNVQGVILRLNFPDNRVQLVRLVTEDNGESNFPMPKFENSENLDFLEGSLEDSFKLTKMLYERLMKIKEKINSKTKYTKESVYSSSVKKLSFIYEKARELMKELDENLLSKYDNWKTEKKHEKDIHVIDLSDDEKKATPVEPKTPQNQVRSSIFTKKGKLFTQDDDSDIEMIVAASGNLIASQRTLRSSTKKNSVASPLPNRANKHTPSTIALDKLPHNIASKRRKIMRRQRGRRANGEGTEADPLDPLALSDAEELLLNGEKMTPPQPNAKRRKHDANQS